MGTPVKSEKQGIMGPAEPKGDPGLKGQKGHAAGARWHAGTQRRAW